MALIRWEPTRPPARARTRELQTIQNEMNRLLGSVFDSHTGGNRSGAAPRRWVPAMDLAEEAGRYVLRADLPGVREQDVKVELDERVLTVSGERRAEREERGEGYYRVERSSGSFSRSLVLPEGVDPQGIHAHLEHGVLEVSVPKPAKRTPHRVSIEVAGNAGQANAAEANGAPSSPKGEHPAGAQAERATAEGAATPGAAA